MQAVIIRDTGKEGPGHYRCVHSNGTEVWAKLITAELLTPTVPLITFFFFSRFHDFVGLPV